VVVRFLLVLAVMAVALSALWVLGFVWRRGRLRSEPVLSFMLVATFLYAFGYGLELAGTSVSWKLATFWIQHLGIVAAPVLLILIAGRYAFGRVLRSRVTIGGAIALSALAYLLVITPGWHELYHVGPRLDTSGPFPTLAFDRGPAYVVFHGYVVAALLGSNAAFLQAWRTAAPPRRRQARTLMLASLIPWGFLMLYLFGLVPWGLDALPFALAFTTWFFYRGIERHGLAHVLPLARERLFDSMGDPVLVLDDEGYVIDRNPAGAALLGGAAAEGLPVAPRLVDVPSLADALSAPPNGDTPAVHVDGRSYGVRLVPLRGPGGRDVGRAVVLRDVTSYEEMQWRLRELATTDELTGIPNRRHFLELAERFLAQSRRSGRPLGCVVFDVDRFKRVNDRYGHEAGDRVLRAVAEALSETVRASDAIGRLGGEEFGVVLPDTDVDGTHALGERLRATIKELQVPISTGSVSVTISAGVCVTSGDALDLDTVLALADTAMYEAKRAGRDQVAMMQPSLAS
jgi:diguanylate cyclase (GGDEF)-like protein